MGPLRRARGPRPRSAERRSLATPPRRTPSRLGDGFLGRCRGRDGRVARDDRDVVAGEVDADDAEHEVEQLDRAEADARADEGEGVDLEEVPGLRLVRAVARDLPERRAHGRTEREERLLVTLFEAQVVPSERA